MARNERFLICVSYVKHLASENLKVVLGRKVNICDEIPREVGERN
jgi:hypothetical protein